MQPNVIVETRKLTKIYRDFWGRQKKTALRALNMEIRQGEIFGLLGPNGSGKTTTVKLLLGLLYPTEGEAFVQELRNHVASEIGPIAKPRQIMIVAELPKTRSGKIMRRLLRDVADHRELGDVTTLTDSSVMDMIKTQAATAPAEE